MDAQDAVNYHDGAFPPRDLKLDIILESLLKATAALARYDPVRI